MKALALTCAAALLLSLTQAGCAADPAKPAQAAASGKINILLGDPVTCTPTQIPCNVPVTVQNFVGPNNQTLCLATLTSQVILTGTSSVAKNRRIVWTISPATIGNFSYTFLTTDHGILITADSLNQITGRGIGDGNGNNSATMFHAIDAQSVVNSSATYLPIVLQTDSSTSPATVTLCAVADPKIINSN